MSITFDNALGVFPHTLQFRSERAQVLSGNLANIDTPGFKAKDLDFDKVLGQQKAAIRLGVTDTSHISLSGNPDLDAALVNGAIVERDVEQPSADGNTVDLGKEQAAFMRNRMEFETSFTFLRAKFSGLETAITGQ